MAYDYKNKGTMQKQSQTDYLPLNALGLYYFNLLSLIDKKNVFAIKNEYDDWCDSLRCLLTMVSWRMKKKEAKDLMIELNAVDRKINNQRKTNTLAQNKFGIKDALYTLDLQLMQVIGENFLKSSAKVGINGLDALRSQYPDAGL
jgi:hypothetical protein